MIQPHVRHMLIGLALAGVLALAACTGGSASETAAGPAEAQPPTVPASETVTDSPTLETETSAPTAETDPTRSTETAGDEAQPVRFPPERYADLEIVTLLPQDAIPAIDNPRFLSATEADEFYDPEELVMGVEFGGEARAYSVPFLSRHEIVNDTVSGVKIAVTW